MTQIAEDYQVMLVWKERALKAEKFKEYVHERLDAAGVDKHEEQNTINGCRIGSRLDDVLNLPRKNTHIWVQGIPKVQDDSRQKFTVKLQDKTTRQLWWLQNYTVDAHGDSSQLIGWHTCRSEQGYDKFFREYKKQVVSSYLVEIASLQQ